MHQTSGISASFLEALKKRVEEDKDIIITFRGHERTGMIYYSLLLYQAIARYNN